MGGYIQGGKRQWDINYVGTKSFIGHWLNNFDKTIMAYDLIYITNDEI